jgi:hypothetical protein
MAFGFLDGGQRESFHPARTRLLDARKEVIYSARISWALGDFASYGGSGRRRTEFSQSALLDRVERRPVDLGVPVDLDPVVRSDGDERVVGDSRGGLGATVHA